MTQRAAAKSRVRFGYEPALDGLRAIAVIAVVLYHVHSLAPARFGFAKGGYFGVELFFVVSGYLITVLLAQEVRETKTVDLAQFWLRRARRLLPAVLVLLVVIGIVAVFAAPETLARYRRDLPWAVFYVSNWGQVADSTSGYFAQLGSPPLLRHLWSLAVEEQWYLIWPVAFGWLMRRRVARVGVILFGLGLLAGVLGIVLYDGSESRTNFVYLSTITRSSGLLIGAALAMVWRPWSSGAARRGALGILDVAAAVGVGAFLFVVAGWSNTSAVVYRGGMLIVSLLSAVLIALAVHPGAVRARAVLGSTPLAAIGRRSYGLYLWHWPILVLTDAPRSMARLLFVLVLVAVVTEAGYRLIEQPFRAGLLGHWFGDQGRPQVERVGYLAAAVFVAGSLAVALASAEETTGIVGGARVAFELSTSTSIVGSATSTVSVAGASIAPGTETVASSVPVGPVAVVVVGDSQAQSLVSNRPDGIEAVFTLTDGSVDGCGVWDDGTIWSRLDGFKRPNSPCGGWSERWAFSVTNARAELALVVIGAWDVFDVAYNEGVAGFASAQWDAKFAASLLKGINALAGAGAKVGLLEVPCMNPVQARGAAVPPLPERGEPWRVGHVNDLLRAIASANAANVTFVEGPDEWCANATIAKDLAYRWDGVHVWRPGAKLVFDTIAPAMLMAVGR